MRQRVMLAAAVAMLAGCDNITGVDNRDPPASILTGRVVYQGQPIGVRHHGVELELWEPEYIERYGQREKIPVFVAQDGSFQATLFDGTYQLNLLADNGPWVNSPDTTVIELNGSATVDIEVTPYYTIDDPSFSRGEPTDDVPGGSISATFGVGQVDTRLPLEFVGLYVGVTRFVDRINSVNVPNRERSLTDIQPQLDANGDITISVDLPDDIYETNSPAIRDVVYVRVGVKTLGVAEMLLSPVMEVGI